MYSRKTVLSLIAVVVVLGMGTAPAQAGDSLSQTTFGSNFFFASPRCPVRDFPTFENIAPIPAVLDTDLFDDALFTCFVDVEKNGKGVNKAKGTWSTELIVRDNNTGMLDSFPIDSGRFKTDGDGFADFDFEIPTAIFADGFESGDVSAWSYTRADFTNKKKADQASVQCGKSASRSND